MTWSARSNTNGWTVRPNAFDPRTRTPIVGTLNGPRRSAQRPGRRILAQFPPSISLPSMPCAGVRVAHDLLAERAYGKSAKQALIVVAVKLLHTLYAMLKHRRPYNPLVYSSLRRRLGLDISWDVSEKDGWRGV